MKVKFYMAEMLIVPETDVEEQWIDSFGCDPICFVKHGITPAYIVGILIRQRGKEDKRGIDKKALERCAASIVNHVASIMDVDSGIRQDYNDECDAVVVDKLIELLKTNGVNNEKPKTD